MKVLWAFCLMVFLSGNSFVFAADRPLQKIGRGATNVICAPVEIVKQARAYWIEGSQYTQHISFWIFSGMVKGVVETVKRTGSGFWDILSFPWEKPQNYEPLIKPDYPWQEWPDREEIQKRGKKPPQDRD